MERERRRRIRERKMRERREKEEREDAEVNGGGVRSVGWGGNGEKVREGLRGRKDCASLQQ